MIDAQAAKFAGVWAENAAAQVAKIQTLDALDGWILTNRYHLADVERANAPAWDLLRGVLHNRDAEIRDRIRQGVG